jgi:hypothetical protein
MTYDPNEHRQNGGTFRIDLADMFWLWRDGKSTREIAREMALPEAFVYNTLPKLRADVKSGQGLPRGKIAHNIDDHPTLRTYEFKRRK